MIKPIMMGLVAGSLLALNVAPAQAQNCEARCEALFPPIPAGGTGAPPVSSCGSPNKTPSGPITAQSGQVIENLHITNPTGACIVVPSNVTNVIIRNNEIGPCGNVTRAIQNEGVRIESGASNITIQSNVIHDMSTALLARGARHPIIFDRNYVYNIRGPMWQGQMVQFAGVRGGTGSSKITCNVKDGVNVPAPVTGSTRVEDHISLYNTLGTSNAEPIEIAFNRIRGGLSGQGESGSGMQLGDSPAGGGGSGSAESGYYYVHDNTIVRTNGSGISVAGGHDIRIENNRVENRGENLASMTGWPFAVKNFDVNSRCYNISHVNNRATGRLWAFNHDGSEATYILRFGGTCEFTESGNNMNDRTLTPAMFDEVYAQCNSQCTPGGAGSNTQAGGTGGNTGGNTGGGNTGVTPMPVVPPAVNNEYGVTQIFQLANPNLTAAIGQNIMLSLRYYTVRMPWVTKPFVHLLNADNSEVQSPICPLDACNHYWHAPSDTWGGQGEQRYLQFEYKYLVNHVPPGTYKIAIGFHQGVVPYAWDPNLYQCNGVPQVGNGSNGKMCVVGTLTVTPGNGTVDNSLFVPQSYYRMTGVPWR